MKWIAQQLAKIIAIWSGFQWRSKAVDKNECDVREMLNKRYCARRGGAINLEELAKTSPNIYK